MRSVLFIAITKTKLKYDKETDILSVDAYRHHQSELPKF